MKLQGQPILFLQAQVKGEFDDAIAYDTKYSVYC